MPTYSIDISNIYSNGNFLSNLYSAKKQYGLFLLPVILLSLIMGF